MLIAFGDQQAVGLVLAATNSASELVELGKAKPVGAFDQDNRGVGNIHAHLYDRCGDQDIDLTRPEGAHHLLLLVAFHASVQQANFVIIENLLLEVLVLLDGGLRLHLL